MGAGPGRLGWILTIADYQIFDLMAVICGTALLDSMKFRGM